MIRKVLFVVFVIIFTSSCSVFKGVEGVNGRNGKVIGGSPSKEIRTGIRSERKQKRQYDREMKKRVKRLGTKKK